MKRFKSLIRKDKSLRATNDPGYDVVSSDLSTFRGPTELPRFKFEKSEERSPWEMSQNEISPWDKPSLSPRKEDNLPSDMVDIVLPPLPTHPSQNSRELYAPFSSVGSHDSAGNARIPDEDLLGPASDMETESRSLNFTSQNAPVAQSVSQEQKRRRRGESHNMVERRRRDNINESIRTLASLAPGGTDRDRPKQAILEKAVSWTRDLMWALHLKTQRESTLKDTIQNLGGSPFIADTVDSLDNVEESIVEKEVQIALATNNITSFSSADHAPRHKRRASEPFKEHSIYHRKPHENPPPRRLHKVSSRGSIISYVASVHSVTSLTYRSPAGVIETETREETSNLSYYPPNQPKKLQSRQDSNDSKYTQEFLKANLSSNETLMLEQTVKPLATSEGFMTSMKDDSSSPQIRTDPQISSKMDENNIENSKEKPRRNEDLVAQKASMADDGSSSGLASAANIEDTIENRDARSPTGHSGQGALYTKHDLFGTTESSNLQMEMNAEDDLSHLDRAATDAQHANYRAVYLDNGLVRLRWTCSCNHPFQVDVLEHQKRAAVTAINELAHCTDGNESGPDLQYPLRSFSGLSEKIMNVFRSSQASDESLPHAVVPSSKADDLARGNPEAPNPGPDRYICVCFPGITYKKYLHHVDVNRAANDPMLFSALKRKYFDWKPLWRRILTLRTLARVEYFEFKVFHSNLVTIKDDWRDRFPQGHGPEEWSYTPTTRDMTPYLIDDVLTHYVHNPECAKRGTYFWKRIPKKLFCQLECPDDRPFKVGWGLYFIEDFSQLYLMLILVPVLVGGVAVAAWYCASYGKSFADGATVASGFAALVMYMFSVAQGWAKQKGNI